MIQEEQKTEEDFSRGVKKFRWIEKPLQYSSVKRKKEKKKKKIGRRKEREEYKCPKMVKRERI